jgi:hypothetical protein
VARFSLKCGHELPAPRPAPARAAALRPHRLPLHAQEKPAAESKEAPKPAPGQEVDPAIIESIMTCLAAGLTPEWFKTWFVIRETKRNAAGTARQFEATFFVANKPDDNKGEPLQTCGAQQIPRGRWRA